MPKAPWKIGLPEIDQDLLVLESAALLALAADRCTNKPKHFRRVLAGTPDLPQERLVQQPEQALEFLTEAGLVVPCLNARVSTLSNMKLADVCAALLEESPPRQEPVHICMALLNFWAHFSERDAGKRGDFHNFLGRAVSRIRTFLLSELATVEDQIPRVVPYDVQTEWEPHDPQVIGDNSHWTRGLGPMFHTLAGWDSVWEMPDNGREVEESVAYWAQLPQLALGVLGWADPALGVARWILSGMPVDTPELKFLRLQWGSRALAYFCHPQGDWRPWDYSGRYLSLKCSGPRIRALFSNSEWAELFHRCGGLHIQYHLSCQLLGEGIETKAQTAPTIYSDASEPLSQRQVIVLERFAGWYKQLEDATGHFVSDAEVLVIAPSVGVLGSFRRSPTTRRWYAGSHEAHLLGHESLRPTSRGSAVPSNLHVPKIDPTFRIATAWNLATELCRRHSRYQIVLCETPEGITGLALQNTKSSLVEMLFETNSTKGWAQLAIRPASNPEGQHVVYENVACSSYERALLVLEDKLGVAPKPSGATTKQLLTYRFISSLVRERLLTKQHWTVNHTELAHINGFGDPADAVVKSTVTQVDDFPLWRARLATKRYWLLNRGGETYAAVTDDAKFMAHGDSEFIDLMNVFGKSERSIIKTVGAVLGDVLR